jgi:hypothetical protein
MVHSAKAVPALSAKNTLRRSAMKARLSTERLDMVDLWRHIYGLCCVVRGAVRHHNQGGRQCSEYVTDCGSGVVV